MVNPALLLSDGYNTAAIENSPTKSHTSQNVCHTQ